MHAKLGKTSPIKYDKTMTILSCKLNESLSENPFDFCYSFHFINQMGRILSWIICGDLKLYKTDMNAIK